MEFKRKTTGLYRIRKYNHYLTIEGIIFRNDEIPMFGIIQTTSPKEASGWGIVHIPSERIIVSNFPSQEEVEEFASFLGEMIDLNSLFLCHPQFEFIEEQIKYDVEIAYKKFIRKKKTVYK